jgi:hypothetical protein
MFAYELQVASTGKTILSELSDKGMQVWQRKVTKKLLRDGRRTDAVQESIRNGDVIAGWTNYDTLNRLYPAQMAAFCKQVFRGMNKREN